MNIGPGGPGGLYDALRMGQIKGDKDRLESATSLLESSFYQEMFKVMRETVPEGEFSGGQAESVFAAMLDQHVADEAAARSDRGVGAALYRQLAQAIGIAGPGDETEPGEEGS